MVLQHNMVARQDNCNITEVLKIVNIFIFFRGFFLSKEVCEVNK